MSPEELEQVFVLILTRIASNATDTSGNGGQSLKTFPISEEHNIIIQTFSASVRKQTQVHSLFHSAIMGQ